MTALSVAPMVPAGPALAAAGSLQWQAWRFGQDGFFRAPVLLSGEEEAILLDGGFTFASGEALVEGIAASGKRLTTIYISCSDPDYYFGLKPVAEAFPEARVIASSATIEAIERNVEKKLAVWGPRLGENGPQGTDQIVFAEPRDAETLPLEDQDIEIVTSERMTDRRCLWVPSLRAVFGGVYAFDGLHVWTADTPTSADRAAWVAELDDLIARTPDIVVAGHAAQGTNNGIESLEFTREYLLAYEQEVLATSDSGELIAAMQTRYPDLGLVPALETGAKVVKGEMEW